MNFNLSLTKEQLDIISRALIEAPYRVVAHLIQNINEQLQNQLVKESDISERTKEEEESIAAMV